MKEEQPSRAKKNWAKVKNIILSKSLAHKRKNKKFELFKKDSHVEEGNLITLYSYESYYFVQATPQPLYKELVTFKSDIDATGKWVWQAQQIAAYFLIHYGKKYLVNLQKQLKTKELRILELGAGCSGLAALTLEKVFINLQLQCSLDVLITDGQEENIQFLSKNIELNNSKAAKAKLMKWGDEQTLLNLHSQSKEKVFFDIILVCDCLYFTQFQKQLLLTLDSYLPPNGIVLLVNPRRGDSMIQFLSLAQSVDFQYTFVDFTEQKYQSEVARIRSNELFDEEKDLPYFIELYRKKKIHE